MTDRYYGEFRGEAPPTTNEHTDRKPNVFAFLEAKGNYHKAADAVLHAADQWEQAAHNVTTKGLAHIDEYNQAINTLATTILDYRIARKEMETKKPEGYR